MAMGAAALDPASPAHFLFSSRRVARSTAIRAYAMESFLPGRPVLEAGFDLTCRIQRDFAYDPEATDSATPPDVAFQLKRGVCQDFTHIMIAGLRGLGLPAAYVSGFLRTIAPPGAKRLEGADATHAWVSLWCGPQVGWQGLDPTNGMRTGTDHIVLALGRDYADVSPTDGVVIAAGDHELTVAVDVVPVGDAPQPVRPATRG
jgi:transglutaminase-like putative cysteine protease